MILHNALHQNDGNRCKSLEIAQRKMASDAPRKYRWIADPIDRSIGQGLDGSRIMGRVVHNQVGKWDWSMSFVSWVDSQHGMAPFNGMADTKEEAIAAAEACYDAFLAGKHFGAPMEVVEKTLANERKQLDR